MRHPMFLQIHTLTSYPSTLLNRDDVGFAKRIPFGGVVRTRISSQCLKRHWRRFDGEHSLAELGETHKTELSVRSRHSFDLFVRQPLLKEGFDEALARAATEAVMEAMLGKSEAAKKADETAKAEDGKGKKKPKSDEKSAVQTSQVTVLGRPELEFFLAEARALAKAAGTVDKISDAKKERFSKEWTKNLQGVRLAAGLDAALFGRMVTSDKLARADAAIQVAHAFTVHAEQSETDYFSAVDDLLPETDEGGSGSGHIGNTELTSGLFYSYVVVDVAQLVSNLEGGAASEWRSRDRKLAADVVRSLVHVVSQVSPGAKLGSTAPYAYAHMVLVEAGRSQPRTLANAFLQPISSRGDLLRATYDAVVDYIREVDHVFGTSNRRALAALGPKALLEAIAPPTTLEAIAKFAGAAVLEGA